MTCSYMYYSMVELKNNCCIGVEKGIQKHTVVIKLVFSVHKIVKKENQGSKLRPIWSPMRPAFSPWRLKLLFSRHFGDLNFV